MPDISITVGSDGRKVEISVGGVLEGNKGQRPAAGDMSRRLVEGILGGTMEEGDGRKQG